MKKIVLAVIVALNLGVMSLFAAAETVKPSVVEKIVPSCPANCTVNAETRVIVEGLVTRSGTIVGVNAIKSEDPELSKAAVDAVSQWKFAPATKDGVAIDAVVRIPVDFKPDTKK